MLRALACHLATTRHLTGWAEVSTADLEDFLALAPRNRHQQTYVLYRFFAWARRHHLVLVDPTTALRLGPQPGFTGTVLEPTDQRSLYHRWTCATTHPHERLIGLLALLHAASNARVLDGGGTLLLALVVSDVLLQCLYDDLLLCSAAAGVDGALEEVVGQLKCPVVAI
jgi:hypothetical protein